MDKKSILLEPYTIHLNNKEECMSVKCDFYQTCTLNTINYMYKTKHKFIPIVIDQNKCYSFDSGKRSELTDNNYPHLLRKFIQPS